MNMNLTGIFKLRLTKNITNLFTSFLVQKCQSHGRLKWLRQAKPVKTEQISDLSCSEFKSRQNNFGSQILVRGINSGLRGFCFELNGGEAEAAKKYTGNFFFTDKEILGSKFFQHV